MNTKIVIFHPALAPYRIDFFNALHEAFDISFYFEHQNPLEQNFDQRDLNKRTRFSYSYLRPGVFGIKNLRLSVLGILRREKPAMVFISEYNLIGLLVVLYKFIFNRKLKIVITCDDNLNMVSSVGQIKRLVRSFLVRNVNLIIVANDLVKAKYEELFPRNCQFFYFPIIQKDSLFRKRLEEAYPLVSDLREKYELDSKKIVLYVGRLVKVKNVELLLDAFIRYLSEHIDAVLLIVGDGNERHLLEHKVSYYIQKRQIFFVGKKEGRELMSYYNLGEIFVLPSVYEPFGTVVNEALLAGCYVLCSSVAGSARLIKEGQNGSLFDPANLNELEDKLRQSLEKEFVKKENRMLLPFEQYMEPLKRYLESLLNS